MAEQIGIDGGQREPEVVSVYRFPGGMMPERQSGEAIGYDVHARAIVSPTEMDAAYPILRRTIFDFVSIPADASSQEKIEWIDNPEHSDDGVWAWRLDPGERVLIGIGIATDLPRPASGNRWFFWLSPRSGMASKYGITIANAPGTIDADYRGEAAAALINQGEKPFYITHGDRIAQAIFMEVPRVEMAEVFTHEELGHTERGSGGFGSTGGFRVQSTVGSEEAEQVFRVT